MRKNYNENYPPVYNCTTYLCIQLPHHVVLICTCKELPLVRLRVLKKTWAKTENVGPGKDWKRGPWKGLRTWALEKTENVGLGKDWERGPWKRLITWALEKTDNVGFGKDWERGPWKRLRTWALEKSLVNIMLAYCTLIGWNRWKAVENLFYFIPLVSCIALFEPDPWSCTSCTVCLIIPAGFVLRPHCPKNKLNLRIKPWACQISSGFSCKIYVWFGLHIRLRNQTYIDASAMAGSFLSGDSD